MLQHQRKRVSGHNFKTLNRVCRTRLEEAQQLESDLRAINPDPCRRTVGNRGHQPEVSRRDDAERTFSTSNQLGQIITAIVFLERGQTIINTAVGQHRLNPEHKLTHRAEAQHLCAACIGCDQSADGCRPFGTQCQREAHSRCVRTTVKRFKNKSRFGNNRTTLSVEHPDLVHPAQRHD